MFRHAGVIFLAALAAAGCVPPPLRFTGSDVAGRGLAVHGVKDKDAILVVHGRPAFGLGLPYAEDWEFDPRPGTPVFARSSSAEMVASVQVGREGERIEEESYL